VWITTGLAYRCEYTVQAHTYIAKSNGVPTETLKAMLEEHGELPPRLHALRTFTLDVIECRGHIHSESASRFLGAGFNVRNMLDVILGVSQKTMSTLLNGLAKTEIDARFHTAASRS
jgi:alkylhydroperoxidase family enzyme